MKVYWKQLANESVGKNEHGDNVYVTEERSGEIVGTFADGGGTDDQYLVIALPDGSFNTRTISKCYHKNVINK